MDRQQHVCTEQRPILQSIFTRRYKLIELFVRRDVCETAVKEKEKEKEPFVAFAHTQDQVPGSVSGQCLMSPRPYDLFSAANTNEYI